MLRLSIPQIPHGGCAIQRRFDASTRHTKRRGHRKSNRSSHVGNGYNGSFAHLLSLSNLRLRTASKSQQQRSIDAIPHKSRSYRTHESLPIVRRCWMKIVERSFRRKHYLRKTGGRSLNRLHIGVFVYKQVVLRDLLDENIGDCVRINEAPVFLFQ